MTPNRKEQILEALRILEYSSSAVDTIKRQELEHELAGLDLDDPSNPLLDLIMEANARNLRVVFEHVPGTTDPVATGVRILELAPWNSGATNMLDGQPLKSLLARCTEPTESLADCCVDLLKQLRESLG